MQMNTRPHFDAVILADGEFPTADIPLQILREAKFLCCCDGAAAKAIAQGFMPDAIVGDGDSLTPEFKTRYAAIIHTLSLATVTLLHLNSRHDMPPSSTWKVSKKTTT